MAACSGGCAFGDVRESTFRLCPRCSFRHADPLEEDDFDRADVDRFASDSVARRVRIGGASVGVEPCFDPRSGRLRGAGGPLGGCSRNFFLGYLSRLSFIQIGRFDGAADTVLDGVLI